MGVCDNLFLHLFPDFAHGGLSDRTYFDIETSGLTLLSKQKVDKRKRNEDEQAAKRRRVDEGKAELPVYATKFSDEVLAAEERRPKKKVAVLIGYAGTGYKGMQL